MKNKITILGLLLGVSVAQAGLVADHFTSTELESIRAELQGRRDDFFTSERGKPFVPVKIKVNWKEGREFTREYNRSVGLFVMRAFKLNEQLDEANAAIVDMCQYHLDRPNTLVARGIIAATAGSIFLIGWLMNRAGRKSVEKNQAKGQEI